MVINIPMNRSKILKLSHWCISFYGYNVKLAPTVFSILDTDECQVVENACSGKGRCINFQGGAFCHCTQGYEFNRDNFACEGRIF